MGQTVTKIEVPEGKILHVKVGREIQKPKKLKACCACRETRLARDAW